MNAHTLLGELNIWPHWEKTTRNLWLISPGLCPLYMRDMSNSHYNGALCEILFLASSFLCCSSPLPCYFLMEALCFINHLHVSYVSGIIARQLLPEALLGRRVYGMGSLEGELLTSQMIRISSLEISGLLTGMVKLEWWFSKCGPQATSISIFWECF